MKAAVRCESLDMAGLARAEKHGRRDDWIGKQRKIRDRKPLVAGGLNLLERYEKHTEGARQNKGAKKPVLHFIVRFPPEVLTDEGPSSFSVLDREGRERLMLKQAVRFIQDTHGGQAVFAARLDRDEAGETVVDVFACPKYLKESKSARREPTLWTSATRFGEELARTHQDHIRARMKDAKTAKPITSPRAVGIALQESFGQFFERENGVKLDPRKLKNSTAKDRIEVEEWRLRQIETEALEAEASRDRAESQAESVRAQTKTEKEAFRRQAREWVEREKTSLASKHRQADADRAAAAADLMTARTVLDRLKETYLAVRQSLPRIRQILTWDLATDAETRQAKADRKQVVKISPILRNAIRDAEDQAGRVSASPKQSGPEPASHDSGPGF